MLLISHSLSLIFCSTVRYSCRKTAGRNSDCDSGKGKGRKPRLRRNRPQDTKSERHRHTHARRNKKHTAANFSMVGPARSYSCTARAVSARPSPAARSASSSEDLSNRLESVCCARACVRVCMDEQAVHDVAATSNERESESKQCSLDFGQGGDCPRRIGLPQNANLDYTAGKSKTNEKESRTS